MMITGKHIALKSFVTRVVNIVIANVIHSSIISKQSKSLYFESTLSAGFKVSDFPAALPKRLAFSA